MIKWREEIVLLDRKTLKKKVHLSYMWRGELIFKFLSPPVIEFIFRWRGDFRTEMSSD